MQTVQKYLFTTYFLFRCVYVQNQKNEFESHLATKTPYRAIENPTVDKIKSAGKPTKIWMIIRHGSRFPSKNHIKKINLRILTIKEQILKNCAGCLSKDELEHLRKWQVFYDPKIESKLSFEGQKEMQNLARRMQTRFPTVLTAKYIPGIYQFNFANSERTLESARHFSIGLFGKEEIAESDGNNKVAWLFDVKQDATTSLVEERKRFEESYFARTAVEKINKKNNLDISFEDLDLMFKTCGIETACNGNEMSPWCFLLDAETLKVMEFAEDLKRYWLDGYGWNFIYRQAYPIFKHMIDFLENKTANPTVILNFTHSGALLKLLTFLHLYRDEKLLTYEASTRKWQLSKIGGFGANVTFVLYLCNDVKKILVLHQERAIRLPCCPRNDFCDLDVMKKYYSMKI